MPGTVEIPKDIGSGGAHLSPFSHSGGLVAVLESLLTDLQDFATEYNAHTHGGGVGNSPTDASPSEAATIGTTLEP